MALAPPAREEAVTAALCDLCVPAHRDWCLVNDDLATLARARGMRAIGAKQRRGLVSACRARNTYPDAISAMASPSVSIMSSYISSGANGSAVVAFPAEAGWTTDARS